jgi:acyl carrier protein
MFEVQINKSEDKRRKAMLERIAEIIKEQLNADGITITMDTSFEKDLEADSLDLFELVMTLEDEYGVEIPSEELENLTTVGEVIKYLESKGVEA